MNSAAFHSSSLPAGFSGYNKHPAEAPPTHNYDAHYTRPDRYMPPTKRGRYHSPPRSPINLPHRENDPPTSPTDLQPLMATLRSIVSARYPDAMGLFEALNERINPAPVMLKPEVVQWPVPELTDVRQQRLLAEGLLSLDPITKRFRITLEPLLRPLRAGPAVEPTLLLPSQVIPVPVSPPEAKPVSVPEPVSPPAPAEDTWTSKLAALPVVPEQARVVIWNGILARNDKKKTPVIIKRLCGPIEQYLPAKDSVLSISHRSAYEEMLKKDLGAIGIFEAANAESAKLFQEYVQYFHEKNRAGVVRLERPEYQMIYLMPGNAAGVSEALKGVLPSNAEQILIGILGRTSPVVAAS